MWRQGKIHPNTLIAYEHGREGRVPPQLHGDVCVRQSRFVDERRGMKRDGRCQYP
jgi:hypothetical protein